MVLKPIYVAVIGGNGRQNARDLTSVMNLLISLCNLSKSQISDYPNKP
jgi:hypothetical protein